MHIYTYIYIHMHTYTYTYIHTQYFIFTRAASPSPLSLKWYSTHTHTHSHTHTHTCISYSQEQHLPLSSHLSGTTQYQHNLLLCFLDISINLHLFHVHANRFYMTYSNRLIIYYSIWYRQMMHIHIHEEC